MEKGLHFHHNLKFTAMNNVKNYFNSTIDDMVFENRNQAYGAYELRKSSNKHLKVALFVGILVSSVVTAFSLNNNKIEENDYKKEIITVITEIEDIPVMPKMEPPKPVVQEPVQSASIAFNEFVAKKDPIQTEEIVTIEQLKGKEISTKTIEGPIIETPIIKEKIVITEPVVKRNEIITIAEQMPEYSGGFTAMQRDIQKQVRYPSAAMRNETEGTVYVSFVVNADGSVSDIGLVRGIGDGCDEEAMEAVSKLKIWNPGKQNGQTVRVKITIPIKFELDN